MRYLLDTHVFLWWLSSDKRLKESWVNIISDPKNDVLVSVASAWEMSMKVQLGKLTLKTSLEDCFSNTQFTFLDISLDHVLTLSHLPMKHKDPFDRILIAQAKAEQCILITEDKKIQVYDVPFLNSYMRT